MNYLLYNQQQLPFDLPKLVDTEDISILFSIGSLIFFSLFTLIQIVVFTLK